MSKYLSKSHSKLSAYVPGEQPRDRKYIKLNTNESPFPPSPYAMRLARQAAGDLNLYPDPNCTALKDIAAEKFGVEPENIIFTNSSDETLNFAFSAFCDSACGAAFPDITYGFYKVFAELYGVEYTQIPLDSDLKINVSDYIDIGKTVFIANPNAPTGILLSLAEIEQIAAGNMNNVVVIDYQSGDTTYMETLVWDRNSKRIFSNHPLMSVNGKRVTYGDGFVSDEKLENPIILRQRGTIEWDDEKTENDQEATD